MAELIGFRLQKDHRANFLIGIKYLTAICLYVCPTRDFLLPLAVASLVFHEILLPLKSLFSGEIKIFGIHFLGSLSPNNYLSNANILTFLILPFVFFCENTVFESSLKISHFLMYSFFIYLFEDN